MPAALADAQIHHIATHRRGGGTALATGDLLTMPDSAAKLDQLVTGVHAMEVTLASVDGKLTRVVQDSADHERRIRVLEAWRWQMLGAATLLGAAASYIIDRLFG